MMRTAIAILFLFFAVQLACGQTLGFSLADNKKRVVIPIEIHNNLVVVPVVLNNTLPLKFIVDTGVRTSILTEKTFSDILSLSYSRRYKIAGAGGENIVEAYVANNVSLELPGVLGPGHAILVLEDDYLELKNYLGTEVHGILGYELFSRFIIELDYANKEMTLTLPERFRKPRKHQIMPITIEDTKPYVVANVEQRNGKKLWLKLLIDTGASHGLMIDPSSDTAIVVPGATVKTALGRGLGGLITGQVGRVNSLAIGSHFLENVLVNYPDETYIDSLKSGSVFRNGSIGGEILSRFDVIFNFPKQEMYLKRNAAFKKQFYYNMSGLTVKADGPRLKKFVITEVREDSPAKRAGIEIKDEIIAINHISTDDLNLNHLHSFFNRAPGKKLSLRIKRGDQVLEKVFRLAEQL